MMILVFGGRAEAVNKTVCPKAGDVLDTSSQRDKEALIQALPHDVISKTYGKNPKFLEYEVEIVRPMNELTGTDKAYYHMAIQNCGIDVANHSWFVRLRFPKVAAMGSSAVGEMFIVKDKTMHWRVWFQYR
ncbi:MAG: hypothetical protein ACE3JN_05925 [Ectobacillus sp.]